VSPSGSGWTSTATSFGFASLPSGCNNAAFGVPATDTNVLFGGDFPNNDPSTSSNGYGNCNVAIDLGTQDSANNGLYPNATVYMQGGASGFSANTTGGMNKFSAVAIAGQLNGKYALFLIGLDATEPWGIYLLQSN
jgi:hypothetical protein